MCTAGGGVAVCGGGWRFAAVERFAAEGWFAAKGVVGFRRDGPPARRRIKCAAVAPRAFLWTTTHTAPLSARTHTTGRPSPSRPRHSVAQLLLDRPRRRSCPSPAVDDRQSENVTVVDREQ